MRRRAGGGHDFIARAGVPDIVIANARGERRHAHRICRGPGCVPPGHGHHVLGMVQTFQPFIAPMRTAGQGTLAGIASVAGFRGLRRRAPTPLQGCRDLLSGIVARRTARSGVKVVTICPGYIRTPMTADQPLPDALHAGGGRGGKGAWRAPSSGKPPSP